MSKRILVVLGHPDEDTLCGALAEAYVDGARRANADVRSLYLGRLRFDPVLHQGYKVIQELEPDLRRAQRDLLWAQHVVFVYPMWWGAMPALMKGFIDRTFLPGFSFKFWSDSSFLWSGLLKGRSARLMITMDGPPLALRLLYRDPAVRQMRDVILRFCGFRPVHVSQFGPVKLATRARRLRWRLDAEDLGRRLA